MSADQKNNSAEFVDKITNLLLEAEKKKDVAAMGHNKSSLFNLIEIIILEESFRPSANNLIELDPLCKQSLALTEHLRAFQFEEGEITSVVAEYEQSQVSQEVLQSVPKITAEAASGLNEAINENIATCSRSATLFDNSKNFVEQKTRSSAPTNSPQKKEGKSNSILGDGSNSETLEMESGCNSWDQSSLSLTNLFREILVITDVKATVYWLPYYIGWTREISQTVRRVTYKSNTGEVIHHVCHAENWCRKKFPSLTKHPNFQMGNKNAWPPEDISCSKPILQITRTVGSDRALVSSIILTHADLKSLMPSNLVNDNMINAYVFSLHAIPDGTRILETYYSHTKQFCRIEKRGKVFLSYNINNSHWVTVKMDFDTNKGVIFDSGTPQRTELESYCLFVP